MTTTTRHQLSNETNIEFLDDPAFPAAITVYDRRTILSADELDALADILIARRICDQPRPVPQWWEKCWRCKNRKFSKDAACVHCGANP